MIRRRPCLECGSNYVAVSLMDGGRIRHRCTSCGYLWYQDADREPQEETA